MLANFQFQVHVQLAAGKVLLVIDICVGSPTSLAQHAHAHFHPSTALLPSRDFPIQALLFPNSTSISFFIPPINTVFYLIERLRQYFILLNDVIKNRKRRACVEATVAIPLYSSVFVCLCVCLSVCVCRLLQLLKDESSASKSFYKLLVMFSWILIRGFAK